MSVFANSPRLTGLIYDLARELEMVVFFPTRDGWGAALVEGTAGHELPDASWCGWQDFGDDFDLPAPVVCPDAAALDAAFASPYGDWADWAHGSAGR